MEREEILENFQAVSQNTNFEECIQILESVNWDLNKAIEGLDNSNEFSIPVEDFNIPMTTAVRDIQFEIDVNGEILFYRVSDNKTIEDVCKLVAEKTGKSVYGLRLQNISSSYSAQTRLSSLNLPHHVQAIPINVEANQSNDKKYTIKISMYKRGEYQQDFNIDFSGKDTIGKVKRHVASITGTDKSKHKWSGWPSNILGSETRLDESGLSFNATLKVDIDPIDETSKRLNLEDKTHTTNIEQSDQIHEDDDDDDYYDYNDSDLLIESILVPESSQNAGATGTTSSLRAGNHKINSFMPAGFSSNALKATFDFVNEFEKKYLNVDQKEKNDMLAHKPPFFIGTLEQSIASTLNLPPLQRKPLFIYVHHCDSIQVNIFCTQTLCYQNFCNFFTGSDYTIWPWDITLPDYKNQLIGQLTRYFGSKIAGNLKIIPKDEFPVLFVLTKTQGTYDLLDKITNARSREDTVTQLLDIKSRFNISQLPDMQAWEDREQREWVKQEQDEAYQKSLEHDQRKEQERRQQEEAQKEAEARRLSEQQNKDDQIQQQINLAIQKLPEEPPEESGNNTSDLVTIRLRLPPSAPNNSLTTRRFLPTHTLEHVIFFMESLGFLRTQYKLLSAFPKKNLTDLPNIKITLKELGLPRRETLIIESI